MIMPSKTKGIIAVLVLLVASKLQVGADRVDIEKEDQDIDSGIAPALTSIGKLVTPSNPNQSIKGLRGGKHRRLQGGEDNTNNNVTSHVSQYNADAFDNNSTADEWPEYDNNSTSDEWPDGTDNFGNNSTANTSEDETDFEKWVNSLDPPVRILVQVAVIGVFFTVVTAFFVTLYFWCGITPCDIAACLCACVCAVILACGDNRRVVYY